MVGFWEDGFGIATRFLKQTNTNLFLTKSSATELLKSAASKFLLVCACA